MMNHLRGLVLLAAGCLALYEAWRIRSSERALWALGLGLVAIGVGVWRITRKPDPPRLQAGRPQKPDEDRGTRTP